MSNLELNKGDQFIIGLDISMSMSNTDCPGGQRRIDYTLESVRTFVAEANKWDPDGVSFYLFGATVHAFRDVQPAEIDTQIAAFKNKLEGATMSHLAIRKAYEEHVEKKNEQTFLLLFTDGEPSDSDAVERTIIEITKAVKDPMEFRIAIITVGERSPSLNQWLKDLDDNLTAKGAKADIVDVKRLEEVDFMTAVNGALTD